MTVKFQWIDGLEPGISKNELRSFSNIIAIIIVPLLRKIYIMIFFINNVLSSVRREQRSPAVVTIQFY